MILYRVITKCTELGFINQVEEYDIVSYEKGGFIRFKLDDFMETSFYTSRLNKVEEGHLDCAEPQLSVYTTHSDLIPFYINMMESIISNKLIDRLFTTITQIESISMVSQ